LEEVEPVADENTPLIGDRTAEDARNGDAENLGIAAQAKRWQHQRWVSFAVSLLLMIVVIVLLVLFGGKSRLAPSVFRLGASRPSITTLRCSMMTDSPRRTSIPLPTLSHRDSCPVLDARLRACSLRDPI
jgi:hypothetical protein